MSQRQYGTPGRRHEPDDVSSHVDQSRPAGAVADILRLQRLAGNSAVTSVIQREPTTRAENIAALTKELADAIADPAKWQDVALRLNAFIAPDLPAICALIPAEHLQAARSAVERHLAGWPMQPAILKAIDARARQKQVGVRPLSSSIWAAYTAVAYGTASKDQVWELIGGSVGRKYDGQNTCAARVSYSLNYGGFPVVSGGEPNESAAAFKSKHGDGKRYIVWAPSLVGYFTRLWGPPDTELTTSTEVDTFEAGLQPDQIAVFVGDGHTGMIKAGYADPHLKTHLPAPVWKLPI